MTPTLFVQTGNGGVLTFSAQLSEIHRIPDGLVIGTIYLSKLTQIMYQSKIVYNSN